MVAARRLGSALVLALALLLGGATRIAEAHPIHTSMAELNYDASARVLNVRVRVFADDFVSAVTRRRGGAETMSSPLPADSAMLRYVGERFVVEAPGVGRVRWAWCGARLEGEVVFVCLRAAVPRSPAGGRMINSLHNELFADQVNIVQATYDGRRRTVLFTIRDGAKGLP